ncbi:dipeptide epimerase [Hyphomonas polymorpha]|uniref:dipeptide epimerase n=1 Tax=Hyphomonas polymorpha TaxID=74319 RepID=UPI0005509956
MPSLDIEVQHDTLQLISPIRIAGYVFETWDRVHVTLRDGAHAGEGEGAGVYFLGETGEQMHAAIERVKSQIRAAPDRETLRSILPPGGARNAVDCAMWALEAARSGREVWQLAGQGTPRPLMTTFTLSAGDPDDMAMAAAGLADARAIKVKLTGDLDLDIQRVKAIRAVRPDVWLGVDGNQGFVRSQLDALIPALVDQEVALLEQPLARGHDPELEDLASPIPLAGDESILSLEDVRSAQGRFHIINIKLDKCGGLTEGLMMAAEARRLGLGVMVGTMICTSLGTAPGFVLGQSCDIVDLDGSTFLARDRSPSVTYRDGTVFADRSVWA